MTGPMFRAGNGEAFLTVLGSLGLDVKALATEAGFPADAWKNPEQSLSLYSLDRMLGEGEKRTGCDHIGLLAGARSRDLGLPSFIFYNAPDLRTGLKDVIELLPLIHEGGVFSMTEDGEHGTFRYLHAARLLGSAHHLTDCVLAHMQSILTRYCGAGFKAAEIRLPRRPPVAMALYRDTFRGARLVFSADIAEIEIPRHFLDLRSPEANPALYRFLKASVPKVRPVNEPVEIRTRRVLRSMILNGRVSSEQIAAALGLSAKQLARRLKESGTTLQKMIAETRHDAARELLRHSDLSINEIAHAVGYSEAAALSRAFREQEGVSPADFKKLVRVKASPQKNRGASR